MASPGSNSISYAPQTHEQPYYEGLFQAADVRRGGAITGGEAVAFFSRSKLAVETLKNIWTVSDQNPTTGSLDRRKFAVSVRLIQLAQNGHKAQGAALDAPPGVVLKPAFFDGVSGVTVQYPLAAPPQPEPAPAMQTPPLPPQQAGFQPQLGVPLQQPAPRSMTPQPPAQPPTAVPPITPNAGIPPSPPVMSATPQAPVMSVALTTQDPYGLTPQEQSRYEDLFPNYEVKKDGYVYGKEAVELFSKSGVPQDQLRDIWNLVDTPVDNRLDKLEFAMAMHLIVCVSKKNLPLPTSLPISLKSLKSQQPTMQATISDLQPDALATAGTMESNDSGFGGASLAAGSMAAGSIGSGPPPLAASGGMSISDAFEGLSTTEPYVSALPSTGPPPLPPLQTPDPLSIPEPTMVPEPAPSAFVETVQEVPEPAPQMMFGAPVPAPSQPHVVAPVQPPRTTTQLAKNYDMGDDHTELTKLKETLQKLQAENISLKAQLGSMSQEEKDLAKETAATVEEISRLSQELTSARAQVLAAKTKLIESTAELSAAKEKKQVLHDLITETHTTKETLDAASRDVDGANANIKASEQKAEAASANANAFEADLFGFGGPALAPVPPAQGAPLAAPLPTTTDPMPGPESSALPPAQGLTPPAPASYPTSSFGAEQVQEPSHEDSGPPTNGTDFVGIPDPQPSQFSGVGIGGPVPGSEPSSLSPGAFGSNPPPLSASVPTKSEVEKLRAEALRAEQTAREAEETRRTLATEADNLRRVADAAEEEVRSLQEKASTKKRGFGRGKRKDQKDVDKAAHEAGERKKHFMEMQMQASNAQTLAMETKRDAEKLRQRAEQAELDLAAAESAREAQQTSTATTVPSEANNNLGYEEPKVENGESFGYGGSLSMGYGNGAPPGGYGGFGGGIMGGSGGPGISIPTPQAGAESYNNPFH